MRYVVDNCGYRAIFDERNGYMLRVGENGKAPFWKENGPELLDVSITNYCERGCDFCYRGSNKNGKFMSLEVYEKILENAEKAGVFQIAIGGGNPNQHPFFIEILKMTREYGIIPSYTTNGQGMTKEIYEASKKYVGAVAVSWYSPYDDAKKVVENCHLYGIPVNIHFVLDAENIGEARELLKNECIENVNAVIFLSYKPVGKVKRKILKKGTELDEFIDELLRYERCQIGFDSCMISHLVEKNELINLSSIDYCEAGRFSAFISEEGNMYPCSFMCGAGIKGYNILNEEMEDIWRTAKEFVDIRDAINWRKGKCMECNLYSLCHGGCPEFDINCKRKEVINNGM